MSVIKNQIPVCTFQKEALFCFGGFELVFYSESKETIYKSLNLKGLVYEPKQNSYSLQSITTCVCFGKVGPILYKVN